MNHQREKPSHPLHPRHGVAMVLVLVFVVVLSSLMVLSFRNTASALRIETTRAIQEQRDEGSLIALARAVALLETGFPPTHTYIGSIEVDTSDGVRSFQVTYTWQGENWYGVESWNINVIPTEAVVLPPPMPSTFAPEP